jgi:hypothetical protein
VLCLYFREAGNSQNATPNFGEGIVPYSATIRIVGNRRNDEMPDYFYLIWFEEGKAYVQETNVDEIRVMKREEIMML